MQKINLRELYPDMYKTDTFLEVTDEVQAVFLSDKRAEAAHERQMYRYKAQYVCAASCVLILAFTTSNRFIPIPSISFLMG